MTEEEQALIKTAVRAGKDTKTRRIRMAGIIAFALGLIAFGVSGWIVYASTLNAANEGAITADQVKAECARGVLSGKICDQAKDTEKAVEDAPAVVTVEGKTGEPGRPATAAETYAAVRLWCAAGTRCKPPGPTQRQVNMAVSALCGTGDRCRGEDGVVTQAQVDMAVVALCGVNAERCRGADGEDMTQEQANAAMVAYCAAREDKCVRTGEPGGEGPKGDEGRGITDVTCTGGTGTFTFTYSDGTTSEEACGPAPSEPASPGPGEGSASE